MYLYMKISLFKNNCPFSVTEVVDTYAKCLPSKLRLEFCMREVVAAFIAAQAELWRIG